MNADRSLVQRLVHSAFPKQRISRFEPLSGGLINTNLKIDFTGDQDAIVLRLYRDGPDVCRKEFALHNLLKDQVPVPTIFHAVPEGLDGSPPFAIMRYINAPTFQQLKLTNNLDAIQHSAYSIGKTLAQIGRIQFPKAGRLLADDGELSVGDPYVEGSDQIPVILDQFLASTTCAERLGPKLVEELHNFAWDRKTLLPNLENESSLVHSDFGNRNILVCEEKGVWQVAAVLDWEFAFAGSPLLDVGNFLRYEKPAQPLREPHFSRAFVEHGGQLPDNWLEVVRLIDLTALVELLTHDELPGDVTVEMLELIKATLKMKCAP